MTYLFYKQLINSTYKFKSEYEPWDLLEIFVNPKYDFDTLKDFLQENPLFILQLAGSDILFDNIAIYQQLLDGDFGYTSNLNDSKPKLGRHFLNHKDEIFHSLNQDNFNSALRKLMIESGDPKYVNSFISWIDSYHNVTNQTRFFYEYYGHGMPNHKFVYNYMMENAQYIVLLQFLSDKIYLGKTLFSEKQNFEPLQLSEMFIWLDSLLNETRLTSLTGLKIPNDFKIYRQMRYTDPLAESTVRDTPYAFNCQFSNFPYGINT